MGIPSYYRKLASTISGFYCAAPEDVDWFLMDFNCLIYQVLHGLEVGADIEDRLIAGTCAYAAEVIAAVNAKNVYIALDGVVPLAKMKQQRMRRFRAIALAAEERRLGLRSGPGWDTNAITPGTAFMDRLGAALRVAFPSATISDVREAGEGEHKAMQMLRAHPKGRHVIYGLDGDLFVLALLNQQLYAPESRIWFFREEVDRESKKTEHIWINLETLSTALKSQVPSLRDYTLAMCLLGNDFVPQSMSFRIKDGGHERLVAMLQRSPPLMTEDGAPAWPAWRKIFNQIAATEERDIASTIAKKKKAVSGKMSHARFATNPTFKGNTATDALKARINDRPLEWFDSADGRLWNGELRPDWKATYAQIGFGAPKGPEAYYHAAAARQYIESVQWTFDYYVHGRVNDWDWSYEFAAAPLFTEIIKVGVPAPVLSISDAPTPVEQLSIVLPPESYHLIPPCAERQFLALRPEYFGPWSYFHLGKRHFWECEAHVPMPTIRLLRSLIRK
jgi:5'-3' exonuclease